MNKIICGYKLNDKQIHVITDAYCILNDDFRDKFAMSADDRDLLKGIFKRNDLPLMFVKNEAFIGRELFSKKNFELKNIDFPLLLNAMPSVKGEVRETLSKIYLNIDYLIGNKDPEIWWV